MFKIRKLLQDLTTTNRKKKFRKSYIAIYFINEIPNIIILRIFNRSTS